MAGKILPTTGDVPNRFKAALSSFGTAIFWAIVATIFPYPILIPYWPAAVAWAPLVLYFLAFFSLIKALNQARQALRPGRPNPTTGRVPQAPPAKAASRAQQADRASRAEARAAKDDRRNAALPRINRPPTVQRMR